jgi:hypothetical protein
MGHENFNVQGGRNCFECDPKICRMCKHLIVSNIDGMQDADLDNPGYYHFEKGCYDKFMKGHKPRDTKTKISIKTCEIKNCCNK